MLANPLAVVSGYLATLFYDQLGKPFQIVELSAIGYKHVACGIGLDT
jgi:hypothetical protein